MSFADDIAEQRRAKAADQAVKDSHDESVQATLSTGSDIVGSTDKLAKSEDIDSVIKQLKEVQLTNLLGASKPSVILTDQTDLGDKISELTDKLTTAVQGTDSSDVDGKQLSALKDVHTTLADLGTGQSSGHSATKQAIDKLTKAVSSIVLSPVVNVPQPKVTVQSQKLDLTPIAEMLDSHYTVPDTDDSLDLSCYRAQDIDNNDPNMQYVGFVNPEGNWYIIENDIKGNSLRYVFGNDDYAVAWPKASSYTYSLLNEAIDALTA